MKTIAIYGAGGFGRETRMLLECINAEREQYAFQGYIDDAPCESVTLAPDGSFNCVSIAIALPSVRRGVRSRISVDYEFPDLIHPDVRVHRTVKRGSGLIICSGVKLTVDVTLGDFVIINLNATIGHDVRIGRFSSIMPSANISGNVTIGEEVFVGSGATILQGLTIGDAAVIGAGAVVTRNVPPGTTAKGVPARWV